MVYVHRVASIPCLLIDKKEIITVADEAASNGDTVVSSAKCGKTPLRLRLALGLDNFLKAAKFYQIASCWDECSKCYIKAGTIQLERSKNQRSLEVSAACFFALAGEARNKYSNVNDAKKFFIKAIKICSTLQEFGACAQLEHKLAERLCDIGQHEEAVHHFCRAAIMYDKQPEFKSVSSFCLLQAGHILGEMEQFQDAATMFIQAADKDIYENLTKLNTKDYLFKASLLFLAAESKAPKESFHGTKAIQLGEKYHQLDGQYWFTAECRFVRNVIQSCKECNIDLFADHVYFFHEVNPLDPWTLRLLGILRIYIENNNRQKNEGD